MKRNIDTQGRLIRGGLAIVLLLIGAWTYWTGLPIWFWLAFLAGGLFVAFEAVKGWCVARACGMKTRF